MGGKAGGGGRSGGGARGGAGAGAVEASGLGSEYDALNAEYRQVRDNGLADLSQTTSNTPILRNEDYKDLRVGDVLYDGRAFDEVISVNRGIPTVRTMFVRADRSGTDRLTADRRKARTDRKISRQDAARLAAQNRRFQRLSTRRSDLATQILSNQLRAIPDLEQRRDLRNSQQFRLLELRTGASERALSNLVR